MGEGIFPEQHQLQPHRPSAKPTVQVLNAEAKRRTNAEAGSCKMLYKVALNEYKNIKTIKVIFARLMRWNL